MKKNYLRPFLLLALLFAAAPCVMQGVAQEVQPTPAVSDGVSITETAQADGTLLETIHITKIPAISFAHSPFLYNEDIARINTPSITLSLDQKMIISIEISEELVNSAYKVFTYNNDFTFNTSDFKNPIIEVEPSSSRNNWQAEKNSLNAPLYSNGSEWFYNSQYCKIWAPQCSGNVTLTFGGYGSDFNNYECIPNSVTVTLNVPITIIAPQATPIANE